MGSTHEKNQGPKISCYFTFKAEISPRDNWRVDMSHLSFGNPFSINNKDICVQSNPKLKGITVSFNTVKLIFEKLEGNFKKAIVFNYLLFKLGVRNNNYVNITVLDNKLELGDIYKLSKLKMEDFLKWE
jgi:hypothetical protein